MFATLSRTSLLIISCAISFTWFSSIAAAATLCVNPQGSHGCYKKIQTAISNASKNDVIKIAAGVYSEDVEIGKPLSLKGDDGTIIDATGQPNGIFVDGLSNPGLRGVTISRLTVINANFEGILVVSASDVTISDSNILDNDKTPGLNFTGETVGCPRAAGF
jgi:pectin methylesterase-like acyl-CoA thioesterase